jgi:hypothetical protein
MSNSNNRKTHQKTGKKNQNKNKNNNNLSRNHIKQYDHAGLIPWINTQEDNIYTVVQTMENVGSITQVAVTDSFTAFGIQLGFLTQYASWTALFDQYRIDLLQFIIRPQYNMQALSAPGALKVPLLYTVIDYDDATVPSTITSLKEYANCSVSMFETVVATFKPHVEMADYNTSVFTSFANMQDRWIDAASAGVPHYGLKLGLEAGISGQTLLQTFDITVKVKVSFRNVH